MATQFNPSTFAVQGQPNYQTTPVAGNQYQGTPNGLTQLSNIMSVGQQAATLPANIQATQAQAQSAVANAQAAQSQANIAQLNNLMSHANNAIANIQTLRTKQDLTPSDIAEMVTNTVTNAGGDQKAVQQVLQTLPKNATKADLKAWLAQQEANAAGHAAALEKAYPAGINPGQIPESYSPQTPSNAPSETNAPEYSKAENQVYPTPVAGQPRAQNPQEEVDRTFGAQYRTNLKQIQQSYPAIRQNYDKLVDQAEQIAETTFFGGSAGTLERSLKAKFGSPEYQQLSKDLANAQIAQIQATGGSLDTVAGQSLAAHANGSVRYDPKVLIDIARRNAANLENSYGQSFGADKASEKFGDANVNRKFRTEWNKNANDNSVFEMQYIYNRAKTPEQGAENVAKYIQESGLSAEKRKELATKYRNLQKLRNEGSL